MLLTDGLFLDHRRCERRAFLNLYKSHSEQDPERGFLLKLRQESVNHLAYVLEHFYPHAIQPTSKHQDFYLRSVETETLMKEGLDCIHNGALLFEEPSRGVTLLGNPHLLIKTAGKSRFGDWAYFPINIQLGRRPKPEYKLIASFHAYLLTKVQGSRADYAQMILRRHNLYTVYLTDWMPRLEKALAQCLTLLLVSSEPEVFISRQRCSLCHWYSHCYTVAQAEQHLSLVPGVTPSRYQSLQSLGISTLASLADASPSLLNPVLGFETVSGLQLQAQSILEKRALIKSNYFHPQLITAPWEFYFDIEAEPELDVEYLLGVLLINTKTKEQRYYALFAEQPEQEALIWSEFLEIINQFPTAPIFHYSEYEVETIKKLAHRYLTPTCLLESLLNRFVDLHYQVTHSVIMPVESYSLKSLGNWLGFYWRDPGISGDQCVCWYDNWLKTGERSFIDSILRYNEDDCQATYRLKQWLLEFLTAVKN